jgi:predicted nucleic acid-binding Zn ribbon protein
MNQCPNCSKLFFTNGFTCSRQCGLQLQQQKLQQKQQQIQIQLHLINQQNQNLQVQQQQQRQTNRMNNFIFSSPSPFANRATPQLKRNVLCGGPCGNFNPSGTFCCGRITL